MSSTNLALVGEYDDTGVVDDWQPGQQAETSAPPPTYKPPRAPRGLQAAGKRLWRSITDQWELSVAELAILLSACRTADTLDTLARLIESLGDDVLVSDAKGTLSVHPAVIEQRQQTAALSKAIASLRIPDEDGERDRRRGGARGPYGVRR